MLVVNFCILLFSYRVFDGIEYFTEIEAWVFLAATTLVCLVSGFVAFSYVPDSHKATFYKRWTWKKHVATFWCNDCVYATDHNRRITTDQEYIRAAIPTWCSPHYTPNEEILEFYEEHWSEWCRDPPDWFDEDFKAIIYENLLEAVQKEQL